MPIPATQAAPKEARRNPLRCAMDNYWTLVVTAPVVLPLIPGYPVQQVAQTFEGLAHAPSWFIDAWAAALAFAFGVHALGCVPLRLPARVGVGQPLGNQQTGPTQG